MNNVVNLSERRIERAKARHTIGQTAAVKHAFIPADVHLPSESDRLMRAHLIQEAFAEQEVDGVELSFEKARQRVDEWLTQAGIRSIQAHEW